MRSRGFTIVEIVITITIMSILMVLAVVGVSSTQSNARDEERVSDIEAIAQNLESFYVAGHDGLSIKGGLTYPATVNMTSANILTTLRDIDPKALTSPNAATSTTISVTNATNSTQTVTGVSPLPTTATYVYQPLRSDGALCTSPTTSGGCRKFNLYYRSEKTNAVQMITSRNQ